jgi:predicted DNA-binding transcriptional regulator YafY
VTRRRTATARRPQVDRVVELMADLHRLDGADVYELAEKYGVTTRSIRRDLNRLEELGYPLHREPDPSGKRIRYRLSGNSPGLDAMHYLALRLAMGDGSAMSQTSTLYASLEDLAEKIEKAVGKRGRARLAAIERCLLPWDKQPYLGPVREFLWPLVEAIQEKRVCRADYRAAVNGGAVRHYEMLPLRIFVHDRSAYLVAKFIGHENVGMLNLSRLQRLEVTDRVEEPPPGFDPDRWAQSAFSLIPSDEQETYVIRFSAAVAPYIRERLWHPNQELRDRPRGGLELTFTGGELAEVARWVTSWGDEAEVIKPTTLRRHLKKFGQWMAKTYAE